MLRAWVPNLQLLPLKNQMPYLLQTLCVEFPGFIKISSWCKLNGVQPVHERNTALFVSLQVQQMSCSGHQELRLDPAQMQITGGWLQ